MNRLDERLRGFCLSPCGRDGLLYAALSAVLFFVLLWRTSLLPAGEGSRLAEAALFTLPLAALAGVALSVAARGRHSRAALLLMLAGALFGMLARLTFVRHVSPDFENYLAGWMGELSRLSFPEAMRRQIGVVETLMSAGRWDEIRYCAVPSRAMMIYRNAFMRHDADRFGEFLQKAARGQAVIHSSALFPYDIVEKVMDMSWRGFRITEDAALEAQWRQLPDYVEAGTNALVIADTSGSMYGRPMATSVGLAVYFAERNTGPYHNMFMSFSGTSRIQMLKGETLAQKIGSINMNDWAANTNLQAAFRHVLEIAVKNRVAQEDIPKSLIVISDMEIDYSGNRDWTFYEKMSRLFRKHGYQIPNIIFWNVASRHDVFHADRNRTGVQLVSGQSASVFRQVMQCVGLNPVEAMEKIINSERYAPIAVA